MPKFSTGDIVIINGLGQDPSLVKFNGCTGVIVGGPRQVIHTFIYDVNLNVDNQDYIFAEEFLSLRLKNEPQTIKSCTCDIMALMYEGCKCGYLTYEKTLQKDQNENTNGANI